jgi:hypothetical protein
MSTLKVDGIRSNSATSDAITLASNGTCTANITNNLSNRNKIINGEAQISQRGTISNHGTSATYTAIDRFATRIGSSFNFDVTSSQSTDAPAGFYKSLKLTPDSTQTPSGSANGGFQTKLEGQDIQDFEFGSSSAKAITLSFYAKSGSSGAGTYSIDIRARPAAGGNDYIQTRAFTVTSSWQRFTFTFEANGLSTSSSLANNNTAGLVIIWHLASGPDDQAAAKTTWASDSSMRTVSGMSNFMSATANEFYITGVQLEVGSVATDFEHRSFGQELQLCNRYYYDVLGPEPETDFAFATGAKYNSTYNLCVVNFPVQMRAVPTLESSTTTNSFYKVINGTTDNYNSHAMLKGSKTGARIYPDSGNDDTGSNGQAVVLHANNSSASGCQLRFNAEL